jgi:hypothetical protein
MWTNSWRVTDADVYTMNAVDDNERAEDTIHTMTGCHSNDQQTL